MDYTYTELEDGLKPDGTRHIIKYKVTPSGTAYRKNTPDRLVQILENLRNRDVRVRISYGDRDTGRSWEEQYDVSGRISRSSGSIKIPLLASTSRSVSGGGILDDSIVKIEYANKRDGGVIWQHPKYHREETEYPASRSYYKPSAKPKRKSTRSRRSSSTLTSIRGMR